MAERYSRNEYLKSLNRMRENYQKYGNGLINRADDTTNVGEEISSFAYMETPTQAPQVEQPKDERNPWQRTIDTITSANSNITEGVTNFLDDIWDFTVTATSWLTGLFSGIWTGITEGDFNKGWEIGTSYVEPATTFEWEQYLNNWWNQQNIGNAILSGDLFTGKWADNWSKLGSKDLLSELHQNSWSSEWGEGGQIVQNIEQGVGYVLPSIVLGIATAGTSLAPQIAIQGGTMFAAGTGAGVETALKEGATVNQAFGYGATKGAISGGITALTVGIGGAVVSKTGTGIVGKGANKIGEQVFSLTKSRGAEVFASKASEVLARSGISFAQSFANQAVEPQIKSIYDNGDALAEAFGNNEKINAFLHRCLTNATTSAITTGLITSAREGIDLATRGREGYLANYYSQKAAAAQNHINKELKSINKDLQANKITVEEARARLLKLDRYNETVEKYGEMSCDLLNELRTTNVDGNEVVDNNIKNLGKNADIAKRLAGVGYSKQQTDVIRDLSKTFIDKNWSDSTKTITMTDNNNSTILWLENSGKGEITQIVNNEAYSVPMQVNNNGDIIISPNSKQGYDAFIVVAKNPSIKNSVINFSNKTLGIPTLDINNNKYTMSSTVVNKLYKSNSFKEIGEMVQSGLSTKQSYVIKNNDNLISVVKYGDKYGVITINSKTNEITNIAIKTSQPKFDKAFIVPKKDEQKLLDTKLENDDGTAMIFDNTSSDFDYDITDYGREPSINLKRTEGSDNNGAFVYSKNPLYVSKLRKEIPFSKVVKTFNMPKSLQRTYEAQLKSKTNEIALLRWIANYKGITIEDVINKLGYDTIVKNDGSVTIFDYGNVISRGVQYKYGTKASDNYNKIIRRNVSDNTLQRLQEYISENGRGLETFEDQFEYGKLIRETFSYKEGSLEFDGERIDYVKFINEEAYAPRLKLIAKYNNHIGIKTRFALRLQEEYCERVAGFYSPSKQTIVLFVDSYGEGTLMQTNLHEIFHALSDKLHILDLLKVNDRVNNLSAKAKKEWNEALKLYSERWSKAYKHNDFFEGNIEEEMLANIYAGTLKISDEDFIRNLVRDVHNIYTKGTRAANKEFYKLLANDEAELNNYYDVEKLDRKDVKFDYGNEFERLQEESRRALKQSSWLERSKTLNDDLRGRIGDILKRELEYRGYGNGNDTRVLSLSSTSPSGVVSHFDVFDNVDGQTFRDIFEVVRTYLPNGELVDLHEVKTTDEGVGYNDTKNYLSKDGLSGFAITKSGDLISVFNMSKTRGWIRAIKPIIDKKAKTLDCYVSNLQNLEEMYSKGLGFKTASVMDWNPEYDHDEIGKTHSEPKVAFMLKTTKDIQIKTFNKDQYTEALDYRNSLLPKQASTQVTSEPTYRDLIKDSANLKHDRVYSMTNVNDMINSVVKGLLDKWSNAKKFRLPTGLSKLKDKSFKDINLSTNLNKTVDDMVNVIENGTVYFDNGENGIEKIEISKLGMHDELADILKELLRTKGKPSVKSQWQQKFDNYANYVHRRALLNSEYITAIRAQKILDKIFEDTRNITIGGDRTVQEISLYKALTNKLLLSKTGKNVAPSSFTKLVNNFTKLSEEEYPDFYDPTIDNLIEVLRSSFEDGKFPDREPTVEEMQTFNLIRGRIITRCRELASTKYAQRGAKAELGAILASIGLEANKPKFYGKLRELADSDISLPVFFRRYLGYDHPLTKLVTNDYLKATSEQIGMSNTLQEFVYQELSGNAGFKKEGALVKELNKKISYSVTDRNGKSHKLTLNEVVGAYWTYRTNTEQLLNTGLTRKNVKNDVDMDFKFTDEDYQKMFNEMPANIKKWADEVFDKFFNGKVTKYRNEMIEKHFGTRNFLTGNTYAPTSRVGQVNTGIAAPSVFDAGYLSTIIQGFLKKRVNNKNHFRWSSATEMINSTIDKDSAWVSKSALIEDARIMLNTTIPSLGNHTLEYYLDKNVPQWKTVWSPLFTKVLLGKSIVDKQHGIIEAIGNAGQVATLGLNVGSVLRQTLSDFSWVIDERVTWTQWLKTIPEAVGNFFRMGQIKKELMEENGFFIERFNRGDVIKSILNGKLPNKIAQVVLKPMEWLDSTVVTTHGYALAKHIVSQGVKDGTYDFSVGSKEYKKEVSNVLQQLVLLTQSNSDPMFMSRLRSGDYSYLAREIAGRFHSDNQNKYQALNEITIEKKYSSKRAEAYRKAAQDESYDEETREEFKKAADREDYHYKKKYGKKVASILAAFVLNGIGAVMITKFNRKLKGKEDWNNFDIASSLKDAVLESTVNWLPYIGTLANAIENNSDVSAFTVEKLNNLVDQFKLFAKAFETGKEEDIRRAVIAFVKDGLELTGIPAKNIYELIMGIWYQFDKEGSLSVQNWVKGYSSSYMKGQYTKALKENNIEYAKGQLGAWSSMYSSTIKDENVINEIVRLEQNGFAATPVANATSYTDDKGNNVSFTVTQATAYKGEYAKASEKVSELLKISDYKTLDDKNKASAISKLYNAYKDSAMAKATGVNPTSKLGQLIYMSNGSIDVAKYVLNLQKLSSIEADDNKTRKEKVIEQINKLKGLNKQEKLLLAYLSGYSVNDTTGLNSYLISKGIKKKDVEAFLGAKK